MTSSFDIFSQIDAEINEETRIYEFINSICNTHVSDLNKNKLRLVLIEPDMQMIQELIPTRLKDSIFSKNDIEYFERQIQISKNFIWTPRLLNMKLLATKDLIKYFHDRKGWKKFHKKYNNRCLKQFSMPIFSIDGQYCILYYNSICNYLDARGNISIYKKVDGKWEQVKRLLETVS